jgi:hypothetical protein
VTKLQTRPLDGFNPNAAPPVTEGKKQVISDTRPAVESYCQEAFDAGERPFQHDLVVINEILDLLQDGKKLKASHKVISGFLRSIGGSDLGQKRIRGKKPHVWAIRHTAEWETVTENYIEKIYRSPYESRLSWSEINSILNDPGFASEGWDS